MSSDYFTNPLIFLIKTFFGLYGMLVLLRFFLQWVRADFYNPISQFVVRLTAPPLRPLRRFLPGIGGLDLSSLVLAWGLKSLELLLIGLLVGLGNQAWGALLWSLPALLEQVFTLFLGAVLIQAILSWVNPNPYHPLSRFLSDLTAPLMRPAQQWLPPMGGLDLSPMLVMVALILLEMLLLPPLKWLTGSPF